MTYPDPPQAHQPANLPPVPAYQPQAAVPPARRAYRPLGAHDAEDDAMQRQIDRSEAVQRRNRDVLVGSLWLGAGLLITLFTMTSDSPVYVVAWGPMLYGLFRIVRGLLVMRRHRT